MKLILLTKHGGLSRQIDLRHPPVVAGLVAAGVFALGLVFVAGLSTAWLGGWSAGNARELRAEIEAQREMTTEVRRGLHENLDALAARLGTLNAHVIRLDALGLRLTRMADLDDGEFNFEATPALGGPEAETAEDARHMALPEFAHEIDLLSRQLEDREQQLDILESLLMTRNLQQQVSPEGRPVQGGWISSYFGRRTDPFTGRVASHQGIDFAGKDGMAVEAVAAGVVSFSGERQGYGNIVEINHGNGFVTRYAHNRANLVAQGDKVEKGQTVALMGATGRATGANLHFEVIRNGRAINPLEYVNRGAG